MGGRLDVFLAGQGEFFLGAAITIIRNLNGLFLTLKSQRHLAAGLSKSNVQFFLGNILRILDAGLHICHMLGYEDLQRGLDFVTDHSAQAMALGEGYGLEVGRPANLVLLSAENDYEVLHGKVIVRRTVGKVVWG